MTFDEQLAIARLIETADESRLRILARDLFARVESYELDIRDSKWVVNSIRRNSIRRNSALDTLEKAGFCQGVFYTDMEPVLRGS